MAKLLTTRVGMREIAAKAGVSLATVSMSLSGHPQVGEQTRLRIRQISRQMGYKARRVPRQMRAVSAEVPQRIGFLMLGGRFDQGAEQVMLRDLTAVAARQAMRMELYCVPTPEVSDSQRAEILAFAAGVDALIVTGYVNAAILQELENRKIPYVVFGSIWGDDQRWDGVYGQIIGLDSLAMGEMATTTFLSEGHRRIAFACRLAPTGLWNDCWLRGYRHALTDAGVTVDPDLIYTGLSMSEAGELFFALKEPPTAYVFPYIDSAVIFLAATRLKGHAVRGDSVIAFRSLDTHDESPFQCRVFTCDGVKTAEALLRRLCELYRQPMPCAMRVMLPFQTDRLGHLPPHG